MQPTQNGETDAFLAHYGVPGMKWGVSRAKSSASAVNKFVKYTAKAGNERDKKILRARANHPKELQKLRQAKADFKVEKSKYRTNAKTVGRAQAQAILERDGKAKLTEARFKYRANRKLANSETSSEYAARLITELMLKGSNAARRYASEGEEYDMYGRRRRATGGYSYDSYGRPRPSNNGTGYNTDGYGRRI